MAVDEEAPEGGAEKEKGKDEGGGGSSSPLVKIVIIAAVVVALVTVTAFVAYKVAGGVRNPAETAAATTDARALSPKPRRTMDVGEIKTVIRGNALKMTIAIGFDAEAEQNKLLEPELVNRMTQLRARYLEILFTMSDAELAPHNIGSLKDKLREETNRLLRDGQIVDVYITEYVFMGK